MENKAGFWASSLLLLWAAGCQGSDAAKVLAPPATVTPGAALFDADRAFADLRSQCNFGPRVPNTTGHRKTRDWIVEQLEKTTDKVQLQSFTRTFPAPNTTGDPLRLDMSNVVAQINPTASKQVLLCAHWDTRPTADMEIDAAKKAQPIMGANDGASGVAVLLELARVFRAKRPDIGVQIVLFDGEDYGPGTDRMFLGARHYAQNPALPKPAYAILIDMIGDKDLQIFREANSENKASDINDKVWKAASELKVGAFQYGVRHEVQDDHIPLQQAGFKAIDLIDFDYPYWHTLDDTPDKCSPAALKAVGDVLARVIYSEKP